MRFGAMIFPTDETIGPLELGRALEERGLESLFVAEHTHIPVPADRVPRSAGGDPLPPEYWRTQDPFVTLAAVAATTERLLVGTGICLVPQRDPITLAKEVASLDHLSGGRFLFGIGAGWNTPEIANHGVDPARRFAVMRERVEAMRRIWTDDDAEYRGEHVAFGPLWSWPKPVQRPHPPILVGGGGARVLERVVAYGDGWIPTARAPGGDLATRIADLQRLAAARGRDPIPVTLIGARPDPDAIAGYAAAGVSRCVFRLPAAPAPQVLAVLDRCAAAADAASATSPRGLQ